MKKKLFEMLTIAVVTGVVFVACRSEGETLAETIHFYEVSENVEEDSAQESGLTVLKETQEGILIQEDVEQVYVHVCGAVEMPGVYALPVGSRLYEATALAGGLSEEADTDGINLAREVKDGEQVRIPFLGEEESDDGLINVNRADETGLCRIPGVGASKAKAIISYREENGPFESVDALMKVSGIKEGLLEQMRPYIKCE